MTPPKKLNDVNLNAAFLKKKWRITIQCPLAGIEQLCSALGRELPLKQGSYDHCLYIRSQGRQQFRALEGSHAGNEKTIQSTDSGEITFTIPMNNDLLEKTFKLLFQYGVHEDPTVHIEEIYSSESKYLDDKNNPNRYWNRSDASEIHGHSLPKDLDK